MAEGSREDSQLNSMERSLLLFLDSLGSNAVHVHSSLLGEGLAHGNGLTVLGIQSRGANKSSLLEHLQGETNVLSSSLAVVLRFGSTSHLGTVVLSEAVNSSLLAHVELIGDGGSASVEPVWVIWTQLFLATSLNVLGPL